MNNVNTDNLISKIIELPRNFRGVLFIDRTVNINMRAVLNACNMAWGDLPKDQRPRLGFVYTNDVNGMAFLNLDEVKTIGEPVTLDTTIYE